MEIFTFSLSVLIYVVIYEMEMLKYSELNCSKRTANVIFS
jgi:hypothetical protein